MAREFTLPDLGEGIAEAQIIRVMIKPGDKIEHDQYLMEVETDKAAVEIPSPFAGTATNVHVKEGQTVNVGEVIVTFDGDSSGGSTASNKPKSSAAPASEAVAVQASTTMTAPAMAPTVGSTNVSPPPTNRKTTAAAAPAVRKLARELGFNLDSIVGSGPGGRITKQDVEQHASSGAATGSASSGSASARQPAPRPMTPAPGTPGQDKWGPIRTAPLAQIRKTIARQMSKSAFTAVHVTHSDDADVSKLDRLRHELNDATDNNPKLTIMPFVIRAVCLAMRKFPIFNASFDEDHGQIVYKDYVNVGVAVDSERGLIVPVIRNADQMSLRQIASSLRSIAEQIRSNQFAIEDLRGGTFTITNVGALGGTYSTPIINHPEVAILGLGRSKQVPVVKDGEIKPALLLPMNLSFDHRATDGADAARFTGEIINYLETPGLFLLD